MSQSPVWVQAEQQELKWLEHVVEVAGCQLQFIAAGDATFTRMLREIEDGERDIVLGASFTVERAKFAYFSPVYSVDKVVLLTRHNRAEQWNNKTLAQLSNENLTFLVPKHGWYGDVVEQWRNQREIQKQLIFYRHDKDAIPDFFRSSADMLLVTTRVLNSQNTQLWQGKLIELQPSLHEDELHFIYSKRSMNFADVQLLNKTISGLLEKGDNPQTFLNAQ
jgi:polar amino acid transport system substrate-binding protein